MKRFIFANLVFSLTSQAHGASCFDGKLPYIKQFSSLEQSSLEKADTMRFSCGELQKAEMSQGKNPVVAAMDSTVATVGGALKGGIMSNFDTLDRNPLERKYKSELERIKKIENPMERIRQVYDLASSASGQVQSDTATVKMSGLWFGTQTPGNAIRHANVHSSVGSDEEFAALLQYSLNAVALRPGPRGPSLKQGEFTSTIAHGQLPGSYGWDDGHPHTWVRVNMPNFDQKGAIGEFTHFDLDTAWYGGRFLPLFPRLSGISDSTREQLLQQCEQVQACLIIQDRKEQEKIQPGEILGAPVRSNSSGSSK